jgi:hypothetical protein
LSVSPARVSGSIFAAASSTEWKNWAADAGHVLAVLQNVTIAKGISSLGLRASKEDAN